MEWPRESGHGLGGQITPAVQSPLSGKADEKALRRLLLLMTPSRRKPGGQDTRNSAVQQAVHVPC
jgi:hypothetical protein